MSGDPNFLLVQEAKRCKYTLIPKNLIEEDVLQIWLHVSQFIIRQLLQQKAVNIPGLGMFSVLQRKLELGGNRKLCVQRPIFILAEKFAKTHGLVYTKYQPAGDIPVVQLNFAVISMDIGYDRDIVEMCIKEIVGAFSRMVSNRKTSCLTFKDIGRLAIKEGKAKMKFSKDFLRTMDGTRALRFSPLTRPNTSDSFISRNSVMSSAPLSRPSTFVLPRINCRSASSLDNGIVDRPPSVISNHSGCLNLSPLDMVAETNNPQEVLDELDELDHSNDNEKMDLTNKPLFPRATKAPPPSAGVISDILAYDGGMEIDEVHKKVKTDLKPSILKTNDNGGNDSDNVQMGNVSFNNKIMEIDETTQKENLKESELCDHNKSGQELCYLCHQRQKRNIPISFTEEKERAELEQDRVLQQYLQLKDQEYYDQERRYHEREREISKEVAQCNLLTSEKIKMEKAPGHEFHHSYIFNRRALSPPRFLTQEQYSKNLGEQVSIKTERLKKQKKENALLEKNEQKHLAQELADARKTFLESKNLATKQYQAALHTQVVNKPFRFPKAEPDSDGPIFGQSDVTPEKVMEMRKRSKDVLNHQLKSTMEKKFKLQQERNENRKYEIEILNRTKKELREDCYKRFQLTNGIRKELENSWNMQHVEKQKRDLADKKHQMTSGMLVLDQCDKYSRCRQCERCCDNIGTSNVWRESRYISGSRLMI